MASSPFALREPADDSACFSVVALDDDERLAGDALLWRIDLHNRSAHIGIALLPGFRGQGLSVEVLHLLVRYGFVVRGLHRLQLETLVDNEAMLAAAGRLGSSGRASYVEQLGPTGTSPTKQCSACWRQIGKIPNGQPKSI